MEVSDLTVNPVPIPIEGFWRGPVLTYFLRAYSGLNVEVINYVIGCITGGWFHTANVWRCYL